MNTLSTIFDWLLSASLRASALTFAVLAAQFVFHKHLGARVRYALWLPVLVVLLAPVLPQSRWSIENVFVKASSPVWLPPPVETTPGLYSAAEVEITDQTPESVDWSKIRLGIWISVSAAFLLFSGFSCFHTLRRFHRARRPLGDEWTAQIRNLSREVGLRHVPRVWCSTAVTTPAVAGLLRPVLLLPADFERAFSAAEARLILRHELTHLKRHDLPLNTLLCVLLALHWFNPLLWLAFFKARLDRESACDAQVLENAPPQRRAEYGHALLKAETAFAPPRFSLGFVGFFQRGAALRFRIHSIANHQPPHPAMKHIATFCITLFTFLGITRAATETEPAARVVIEARFIEFNGEKNLPASADAELEKALDGFTLANPNAAPLKAVFDDADQQLFLRRISAVKGVDLMAVPRLVTHAGQRATVEVTRDFINASGKPVDVDGPKVGVTLDVLPTLAAAGSFDLDLNSKIIEFDGFVDAPNNKKNSVFSERKAQVRTTLQPGQTALLDLGIRTDAQNIIEEGENGGIISQRQDTYTRRAVVLITARSAKEKVSSHDDFTPGKSQNGEGANHDSASSHDDFTPGKSFAPLLTSWISKAALSRDFTPGKSAFRPGDSIRIREVQRGEGFVTVTAEYELASADTAQVALFITSTKHAGVTQVADTQRKVIARGKGTVVLHHPDTHEGLPHVSFYPASHGGQAFGGIYFGTAAEADQSQKLGLDYMTTQAK